VTLITTFISVNALLKFLGSAILIYAAYCGLLFFVQRQVIFPRYMIPSPAPMDLRKKASGSGLDS